jgi:hypothetical protein
MMVNPVWWSAARLLFERAGSQGDRGAASRVQRTSDVEPIEIFMRGAILMRGESLAACAHASLRARSNAQRQRPRAYDLRAENRAMMSTEK